MGDINEFKNRLFHIIRTIDFNYNKTVSLFETNIRILGGLLSSHFLAEKFLKQDYNNELIPIMTDLGDRLIKAFDTPTGIPYGSINLQNGVDVGESNLTCVAGGGTYLLEFGVLSSITKDEKYLVNFLIILNN